ncbi:alpha/beta hydrolase-fold protein [Corynebacterium sp. 335C]
MTTTRRRGDRTPALDERRIATEWAGASEGAVESLLASAREAGGPVWGPDGDRATFLWRVPAGEDPDAPVHLFVNRVTDKDRHELGMMRRVPGTRLLVRTLELSPTLRASYGFAAGRDARRRGGPRTGPAPTRLDPLNPLPPVARDDGGQGLSVLRGPLSPPQEEWEQRDARPVLRGMVLDERLPLDAGPAGRPLRDCVLYLPSPDDAAGPVPLLVLFDAEDWFGRMSLPRALEHAVSAGRIPPVAVLGVANPGRGTRVASLGANDAFLASVAGRATSWAETVAASRGVLLAGRGGRFLAGQSLGGLSALRAAITGEGGYGGVIAQSPSVWWTPDGRSTPADLGSREVDWITAEAARRALPDRPAKVRIQVGCREGLMLPRAHAADQTLRGRGVDSTVSVYDGGHDLAWWRGGLIDALAELV